MRQGWVIFSIEVFGELVKSLGQVSLREEVREDAFKRSPHRLQALARQGAIHLQDGESIQEAIFIQVLVPGVHLTNLSC
jgi:hypothetical protein